MRRVVKELNNYYIIEGKNKIKQDLLKESEIEILAQKITDKMRPPMV
jgi:hypothetical protein